MQKVIPISQAAQEKNIMSDNQAVETAPVTDDVSVDSLLEQVNSLTQSVSKLETNNAKLLDELSSQREDKKTAISKSGVQADSVKSLSELVDQLKQQIDSKETEKQEVTSEKSQLATQFEELQKQFKSIVDAKNAETQAKINLELESSIKDILIESNVTSNGQKLLLAQIKNSLVKDDEGYHYFNGESRISPSEYAKSVVLDYPELVSASVKSGSGSNPPMTPSQMGYNELIAQGRYSEAMALQNS